MSEYDAFNGLSASRYDAKKDRLRDKNARFLKHMESLRKARAKKRLERLLTVTFLVIISTLYFLFK